MKHPLSWIPTLYFAEGLPNVIVTFLACLMYKKLGLSNTEATFYTAWLYLPWVIKPFWSPIVDMLKTKRWWILAMQLIMGASFAGVAFTLPTTEFVRWSLCFFYIIAFSSATHDIAADGFYMIALNTHDQSFYVGVRSTAYRIAMIAGQGLLTLLAGRLEFYTQDPTKAWSITFLVAATLYLSLYIWHNYTLKKLKEDCPVDYVGKGEEITPLQHTILNFTSTIKSFFKKKFIIPTITFLLLYRFSEALITRVCPLFFIDPISKGGLGLTTADVGILQGVLGVIGLLAGGIIGGFCISKGGLRRWMFPMVIAITLPDAFYIFLATTQTTNFTLIAILVSIEQFGYGFGFTAFMVYMLQFAQGPNKTAHYAFCTGFMALSMMLPGAICGYLEEIMGYTTFFTFALLLTPLSFIVAWKIWKLQPQIENSSQRTL